MNITPPLYDSLSLIVMSSATLRTPELILTTEPLIPVLFLIEFALLIVSVAPFTNNTAPSPVEVLFSIVKLSSLTSLLPPADKIYPALFVLVIDTLLISALVVFISMNLFVLVILSNTTLFTKNVPFAVINPSTTLFTFVMLTEDIDTLPPVAFISF